MSDFIIPQDELDELDRQGVRPVGRYSSYEVDKTTILKMQLALTKALQFIPMNEGAFKNDVQDLLSFRVD